MIQYYEELFSRRLFMRSIKRPAVLLITAVLAAYFAFPAVSETKDEVQQQIETLESRQAELENELAALKQNKTDTETYIAELDSKIEECLSNMHDVTDQIRETDEEIGKTQEKLARARADEQLQYAALRARIKAIYESGDETYLSLLFGQGNLRTLLGESEYISKINEYDKNLLVSLEKAGDKIEVYEADLESQKEVLESQKEAYEVEKTSLDTVLAQRKEELSAIGDSISEMDYDLTAIQSKIDAENQVMADILEQERQEAEALAKKEAEEAAKQKAAEAAEAKKAAEEAAAREEAEETEEAETEPVTEAETEEVAETEKEETEETEAETEEETEEEEEETTSSSSYSGPVLTRSAGVVYGPSGKETYYNLDMSGVISIMRGMGFDENSYPYWVRSDGCKMLGDYIMCAANLNVHPRGTTVESSLGTCLVCDTGGFAYSNPNQLDIATNW